MNPPWNHVVVMTQHYPPENGAAQIRLQAMAKDLVARGIRVTVITAMPNYPTGRILPGYRRRLRLSRTEDGIKVIRTWVFARANPSFLNRLASYLSFTVSSLTGIATVKDVDVIFVESPPLFLALSGRVASLLKRAPYILNISDLWPASAEQLGYVSDPRLLRLGRWLEGYAYRHAWAISAVTEGILARLKAAGVAQEKLLFLPNGVDTQMFSPGQHGRSGDESVFLYAGTHGGAQGLDVILDAAALVQDRSDISFLFVGDGPEKQRLRADAERRGLDRVRFEPARPPGQMTDVFHRACASVVPLRDVELFADARPSKVLPSLACGVPVIFCGRGDTARLLAENGCGVTVPPEDPSALAEALLTIADDRPLAAEMGRKGRGLVESDFSWGTVVDRWLDAAGRLGDVSAPRLGRTEVPGE